MNPTLASESITEKKPCLVSDAAIEQHLSAMQSASLLAIDTESTGLRVKDGTNYGTGISVAYPVGDLGLFSIYFPIRHPDSNISRHYFLRLKEILEQKPLTSHNWKHDLHTFRTFGIEPKGRLFDSMIIAHMVNENWPSKELDWLSKTLLNDQKDKAKLEGWTNTFGWEEVPAALMDEYAQHDAILHYKLFEFLWPKLKEQKLHELWPIESAYTRLLCKIEHNGIRVDTEFCKRKVLIGEGRMDACASELGFNPSSPIDLSKFLLDELKLPVVKHTPACKGNKECYKDHLCSEGKASFDKDAMEIYEELLALDDRKEAQRILEYRGWQKAVSSLYDSALTFLSPDGRIRPNFKQHGTRTGRLSCTEPNLQQIPRESIKAWNGDAKKAFIPKDGFTLVEFDYSQLEFRLATAYGRDQELLDAFESDTDVFIPIATRVFGGPEFRQDAKTLVYSTLYGAGVARIMAALGLSEDGAKDVRETFRNSYPGIYEKSDLAKRNVERLGYVKYWTGRKRHLNKTESHKAFNAAVQGGAAEIVKRSGLRIDEQICDENRQLVLTIHDSWVMEIRQDLVEETIPVVKKLMTDWPAFGVKFAVDCHIWGEK